LTGVTRRKHYHPGVVGDAGAHRAAAGGRPERRAGHCGDRLGADPPERVGDGGAHRGAAGGGVDDVPAVRGGLPVAVALPDPFLGPGDGFDRGVQRGVLEVGEHVRAEPAAQCAVGRGVAADTGGERVVRVVAFGPAGDRPRGAGTGGHPGPGEGGDAADPAGRVAAVDRFGQEQRSEVGGRGVGGQHLPGQVERVHGGRHDGGHRGREHERLAHPPRGAGEPVDASMRSGDGPLPGLTCAQRVCAKAAANSRPAVLLQ
jgi:hypothetical protein